MTLTDEMIKTSRPRCQREQNLTEARLNRRDPRQTIYSCLGCSSPILIVGMAVNLKGSQTGVRVGAYSLKNPEDLIVTVNDDEDCVIVPANRHALD